MLDDLKYINQNDPSDALGIAASEYKQLSYQFTVDLSSVNASNIKNIIYLGMGGSALAALLSQSWPGYSIPFSVVRDYDIPEYVGSNTLVIASSYSGNTEETLSALNQAVNKKAQIVIIASGGRLLELASQEDLPYFKIPSGLQPRYAVFYNLRAIVDLLVELKITDPAIKVELEEIAIQLPDIIKKWLPIVRVQDNLAKQIAMEVSGKSVVIYAGPKLAPAAYKWKISFNENAKQLSWWNSYSEFNHNEFIGWTRQPELKPYAVVELRSKLENPRILKRFEISNKLLSGTKPQSIVVNLPGVSLLEDLLYAVALGDFVSIYSAIISGVNPEPVALIEELKKELAN